MDNLDSEVLGWLLYDYEAPHTIAADIVRETKAAVTEDQVLRAMLSLSKAGLAQAFVFDNAIQNYRPVALGDVPDETLWFMATAAGRASAG